MKGIKWRSSEKSCCAQTTRKENLSPWMGENSPLCAGEARQYEEIRRAVPVVDAAINKIIRLVGGFDVKCADPVCQRELQKFCRGVQAGPSARGLDQFIFQYLNDLLTYGNAAGEMVPFRSGRGIGALYNVPLENISVVQGENPLELEFYTYPDGFTAQKAPYPQRILFSALNPNSGDIKGKSILEGLPYMADILMKIYQCIGNNFERLGNLRYGVTYRPNGVLDRGYAKEIASGLAEQWAKTMADTGHIQDFVAVGDVDIKVIGAEAQMMDTQAPVRQILEQMIAKLGLPPFILGLNWSTTERMSKQQADILTSELESYRALLGGIIRRICAAHLQMLGMADDLEVVWKSISIQDEVEQARAALLRAQADTLTGGEEHGTAAGN